MRDKRTGSSLSDRDTQSMIINFLCILNHAFFYFWHSEARNGVRMSEPLQISYSWGGHQHKNHVFIIWSINLEMVADYNTDCYILRHQIYYICISLIGDTRDDPSLPGDTDNDSELCSQSHREHNSALWLSAFL